MKKRKWYIIAAVLVTVFIFFNSMQTAQVSTENSRGFADLLKMVSEKLNIDFGGISAQTIVRKAAHMTEFFVQGLCLAGCFSGRYTKRIIYILFFGLLTACCDEFIQIFSDGRAAMVQDIFIDFGGTIAATLISGMFFGKRRKRA